MKLSKRLLLGLSFSIASVATVVLTGFLATRYLGVGKRASAASCPQIGTVHTLTLTQTEADQAHIDAQRCDQLKVVNQADKLRLMAFGAHEDHEPYDGVSEKALKHGESLTVTLDKTGTYVIHDHLQDDVGASFTVIP